MAWANIAKIYQYRRYDACGVKDVSCLVPEKLYLSLRVVSDSSLGG